MPDYPGLLPVIRRFPDEATCIQHVHKVRRREGGLDCPECGRGLGPPHTRNHHLECPRCGNETDVTQGTLMEETPWRLQTWIVAAHLLDQHPALRPGDAARILGLPQDQTVTLLARLREAVRDPLHRKMLGLDGESVAETMAAR